MNDLSNLNKALLDISSIRRQMAQSTEFRGYGPATLAVTGCFAICAAWMQSIWLPDPIHHVPAYLALWMATAALSASLIAVQTITRTYREHSGMADEMIRMAVEQFLPSCAAGVLLTFVLLRFVPSNLWMVPGLWQLTFSLGIFASCRFLPRLMAAAGGWYLLSGLTCIALGDSRALSPWTMGLAYGVGQLIVAGILLFSAQNGSETYDEE